MISKCPKCNGSLHTSEVYHSIEKRCLNCAYEVFDVPQDVLTEVQELHGKTKGKISHPLHHLTK